MTKKLLILAISTLLIYSCNKKAEVDNKTVITGQVINLTDKDPKVILWNLCDPFDDNRVSIKLSKDGKFRMESEGISYLHDMTIRYNDFISLVAAPGDSINLIIDAAKLNAGEEGAAYFSGDREKTNNEIQNYYNYYSSKIIIPDYSNELNIDLDPKSMVKQINERVDGYKSLLSIYEKQQETPMSDYVRELIERDMIFTLANRLLDYKLDSIDVNLEFLSDPIFGINDSLNFCTMMFDAHLSSYVFTKLKADSTFRQAAEQQNYPEIINNGIRIIETEQPNLSRDVMMWKFLSRLIYENPLLYNSLPEMSNIFRDSKIGDKFTKFSLECISKIEIKETPINGVSYMNSNGDVIELPKGDVFKYFAQKYPNKVIYIDVYATWCGPCRVEMKESNPMLHKKMKDKDVVFINLCLSSDVEDWHKMIPEFGLKENYWFDYDAGQIFMSTYKVDAFPSYILVGKSGEIANLKAGRPSEIKLITEQIDELLK